MLCLIIKIMLCVNDETIHFDKIISTESDMCTYIYLVCEKKTVFFLNYFLRLQFNNRSTAYIFERFEKVDKSRKTIIITIYYIIFFYVLLTKEISSKVGNIDESSGDDDESNESEFANILLFSSSCSSGV